jgi:hypothetical protein
MRASQLAPGQTRVTLDGEGFIWDRSGLTLDFLKITRPPGDGLSLPSGASGVCRWLEIDTWTADGIKVQNSDARAATDWTCEGGYARGHAIAGSIHQDMCQAMGGARIKFRNFVFDGMGNGGFFVQRGGQGVTMPTDIVAEHCAVGGRQANPLNLGTSLRCGMRDSLISRSERFGRGILIDSNAQSPITDRLTEANHVLTFEEMIAFAHGTTPPPPPPPSGDCEDQLAAAKAELAAAHAELVETRSLLDAANTKIANARAALA